MRILRRWKPWRRRELRKLKAIRRWDQGAFRDYDQSVLALIGSMNNEWAGITLIINSLIEWYIGQVGQVIKVGKGYDFPRAFTAKLRFLEKMEPDIRWSPSQRTQLKATRLKLADMNRFRVNIVHGSLSRRNRRTFIWHVHIAKREGRRLSRSSVSYTNEELVVQAQAMSDMTAELSPFVAEIIGLQPSKR